MTEQTTGQPAPSQLLKLATPIPGHLVEKNPKGASYVAHEVITQWLLYAVGPFKFERVEIIRGDVLARELKEKVIEETDGNGKPKRVKVPNLDENGEKVPPFSNLHSKVLLHNVVVGATYRLTCEIDGRTAVIEHTGDVEQPTNWQHDGARLKDAESDAIKRCAREVGAALHLWAGDDYFLAAWLAKREGIGQAPPAPEPVQTEAGPVDPDTGEVLDPKPEAKPAPALAPEAKPAAAPKANGRGAKANGNGKAKTDEPQSNGGIPWESAETWDDGLKLLGKHLGRDGSLPEDDAIKALKIQLPDVAKKITPEAARNLAGGRLAASLRTIWTNLAPAGDLVGADR